MVDIHVYTTLTRKKELFVPIDPAMVRVYSCGPTVYSAPHIGNFRAFMLADMVRATLRYAGNFSVLHVMNITDVGHLTDDGDQGEDKMEKGAKKEGKTVWEVASMYEQQFKDALHAFAIEDFDAYPRATVYMPQQIAMVQQLIQKGYTYEIAGDGIYMDTSQVKDYGKLAQLDIAGLCSHHREEGAMIDSEKKKCITDFALWKYSPHDEKRAMEWVFAGERAGALIIDDDAQVPAQRTGAVVKRGDLSVGEQASRGFPGWHIECSAMSVDLLGEHFDIHTGGVDHIPVHHTNEIAQTECALGIDTGVNYRLHQQFLQVDGGKMSKSKGHDLSVAGIIAKGYDPLDVRYFYLTAHYRSFLDFTREALDAAHASRINMMKKILPFLPLSEDISNIVPGAWYRTMLEALADDIDTVRVLTLMHEGLAKHEKTIVEDIILFDMHITKVGLYEGAMALRERQHLSAPDEIIALAEQRQQAKQAKNYHLADTLREQIAVAGWLVKDGVDGYTLEQK